MATAEDREDLLHVGGTRPAMLMGVPIVLAVGIAVAWYEVQAVIGGLQGIAWAFAICIPAWILARWRVSVDVFGINVAVAALRLLGLAFDRATWGGGSRSPLPAIQPARAMGMRHAG